MRMVAKDKSLNILVVRNDKLGDLLVSLPAFAILKKNLSNSIIFALVPEYTSPIIQATDYIDDVIIDPGRENVFRSSIKLSRMLKQQKFDAVVTLFSTSYTALAVWFARIPYRLAPATKIAQIAYNHRLKQRRSRSIKPEHEYNLDLAKKFLVDIGISNIDYPEPPYLNINSEQPGEVRAKFINKYSLSNLAKLIFVHTGSGGSSNNLSIEQYAKLIKLLDVTEPYHIVLSAGPNEFNHVKQLSRLISNIPHTIYESTEGLSKYIENIALADLFIGGSTGPLHIAGALDVPTAAFYVRLRTSSALRWQTINSPEKRLSFSPDESYGEEDMSGVDLEAAAEKVRTVYLS